MLRTLSAVFLASIVALPLISAAEPKPPSSLEPVHHGSLSLSHEASRIVACNAKLEGKKLECVPERQSADSSAALTLNPIHEGQIGDKDKRQPVQIALPKEGGQAQKLELPVGLWELQWPARTEHDRFYMAQGDEFAIVLKTVVGACRKLKDDCVLRTDKTQLDVAIPKRCRR
jgi:hypothetical protein